MKNWEDDLAIIHKNYEATVKLIKEVETQAYERGWNEGCQSVRYKIQTPFR